VWDKLGQAGTSWTSRDKSGQVGQVGTSGTSRDKLDKPGQAGQAGTSRDKWDKCGTSWTSRDKLDKSGQVDKFITSKQIGNVPGGIIAHMFCIVNPQALAVSILGKNPVSQLYGRTTKEKQCGGVWFLGGETPLG